jgi:riboflavin synthase
VFTGIVQEVGRVISMGSGKLAVAAGRVNSGLEQGDSVAVNGTCLTATAIKPDGFIVGVVPETLRRTNLGRLRPGDRVNLEAALTLGGKLGGHLVQGHVDDICRLVKVLSDGGEIRLKLEPAPGLMRYIVAKGFVTLDGVSLTVAERDESSFQVAVIGFTRDQTTLGERRAGDLINLEVDIIGKYVEQMSRPSGGGVTRDLLEKHGYLAGLNILGE